MLIPLKINMKKLFSILFLFVFAIYSCNKPELNGHYHLQWNDDTTVFQTWNIKDNRMKINDEVCAISDSCSYSQISFTKDSMTVLPWVDIEFTTKYTIDDLGVIQLEDERSNLKFQLKRFDSCISSKDYFQQKLDTLFKSFQLTVNDYMFNKRVFPSNFKNELIIDPMNQNIFVMLNG